MRGRPSVWRRIGVVSGVYQKQEEARITSIMCELEGIEVATFEADCRHWAARFKREGAVTRDDQERIIAGELGIPLEELRAEVDAIAAQVLQLHEAGR